MKAKLFAPMRRFLPILALMASDFLAVFLANRLSIFVRGHMEGGVPIGPHFDLWPFLFLFWVVFAWQRLYSVAGISPADEIKRIVRCVFSVYLLVAVAGFMMQSHTDFSRFVMIFGCLASMVLVVVFRIQVRAWFSAREWWGEPVLVLGAATTGRMLVRNLLRQPYLGWRPIALLDDDVSKHGGSYDGVPVLGGLDRAAALAKERGITTAIVAMPGASVERLRELEEANHHVFPRLVLMPNFCSYASLWVRPCDFGGILGLQVQRNLLMWWPRFCKRVFDLLACSIGAFFIVPLGIIFAVAIKFTSPGPVFYGQNRIGRDGIPFKAWKFRSMIANADSILKEYLASHPELRDEWERDHKLKNDPRVTLVGRILRKTSLDELPQLWNVIRGEMSLIGPRPIVSGEIAKYGGFFPLYTKALPGISGLWQVSGRNDTTYDERVAFDVYYVRNWSLWLDLWILLRTVRVVLLGKGAY